MILFVLIPLNLAFLAWAVGMVYAAQIKRADLVSELLWRPPTPRTKTLALWRWWQICGGGLLTILMCATPIIDTHTTNPLLLLLSWAPEAGFFLFRRLVRRHVDYLESLPPSYWEGKPLPKYWQP